MSEMRVAADELEEFAPVSILTLRPERTLVEKLALLHDRVALAEEHQRSPVRDAIDCVREAIRVPGTVAALAADVEAHSQRYRSRRRRVQGVDSRPVPPGPRQARCGV